MKIGIVTMHKVQNFGSALQAYALQKVLGQFGYDSRIIDYHYSYTEYNPSLFCYLLDKCRYLLKVLLRHPKEHTRFFLFRHKYLRQTWREYTKEAIFRTPPNFDVYMTGSDQVWNCQFTNGDETFLLKFAPEKSVKISYASSFASSMIPEKYKAVFREELSKYSFISVREESGVSIVKDLIGKDAEVVCDPSLLLKADDYYPLTVKSQVHIEGDYILAYILDYMYDPYPGIYEIIKTVRETLGIKVVYIGTRKKASVDLDIICLGGLGPLEFLWLMMNASFVITSSFHGTAFAVINQKPLLAVVQSAGSKDGRIQTLLNTLEQSSSLILYNEKPSSELIKSNAIISKNKNLEKLREASKKTLLKMLQAYE